MERLTSLAALALRIWMMMGVMLRVTQLRDRFDPLAVVFYTTPWPVIAGGMALLALHHWRCRHPHRMHRYSVLAVGALLVWVALSWYSAPRRGEEPSIRLSFWNVAQSEEALPFNAKSLRRESPDVIALAEADIYRPGAIERWQSELPGYAVRPFWGDMLLAVRGKWLRSESGELGPSSYYALHRIEVRGLSYTLLQVDLYARPIVSRREPLQKLSSMVRQRATEPLIVFGDFNTPRDSAHLDPLREELTNCFEQAGAGFIETWPGPLPLLSLDQIWTSPRLRALKCRIGGPLLSDHRAITVDLLAR